MGGYIIRAATADEHPLAYTFIPHLFEGTPPASVFLEISKKNQEIIGAGGLKIVSRNRRPAVYLDISTISNSLEYSLKLLTYLHERAQLHGFNEIFHYRTIEAKHELQFLQAAGYKTISELLDFQVSPDMFTSELERLTKYSAIFLETSALFAIQPLTVENLAEVAPLYIKHFNQSDSLNNLIVKNSGSNVMRANDRSLSLKTGNQVIGVITAYHKSSTLYIESLIVDHIDYSVTAYGYSQLVQQLYTSMSAEGITINSIRFFCDSKIKPITKLAQRTGAELVRSGHKLHFKFSR